MSQTSNPLSASEPWSLVAAGYAETTMLVFEPFAEEAIAASRLQKYRNPPGDQSLPRHHHPRILGQHGQGQRANSDDEKRVGRPMAGKRKPRACLPERMFAQDTDSADFGCVAGHWREVYIHATYSLINRTIQRTI